MFCLEGVQLIPSNSVLEFHIDLFRHTYFMPEMQKPVNLSSLEIQQRRPFYLFNTLLRGEHAPAGKNAKCLLSTSSVVTMYNHFPFSCIQGQDCRNRNNSYYVQPGLAHLHHYRSGCTRQTLTWAQTRL